MAHPNIIIPHDLPEGEVLVARGILCTAHHVELRGAVESSNTKAAAAKKIVISALSSRIKATSSWIDMPVDVL